MVRKYYKFAQWHWHWYISAWHVRINCPQPAASVEGTQKSGRLLGNDRILGKARRRGSWKWSLYVFILCSMLKKMLDDVAKRQQRKRCTAELQWVSPMPSDNSWKYNNKKNPVKHRTHKWKTTLTSLSHCTKCTIQLLSIQAHGFPCAWTDMI